LASGAQASSRSRKTWSAGRVRALSMNFWLEPGTARQDRRARGTAVLTSGLLLGEACGAGDAGMSPRRDGTPRDPPLSASDRARRVLNSSARSERWSRWMHRKAEEGPIPLLYLVSGPTT